jgi:hypothetical protein
MVITKKKKEDLVHYAQRAFTHRDNRHQEVWQDIWRYMAPERDMERVTEGGEVYRYLYDSTAVDALKKLNALLVNGLTPPWFPWFMLMPGIAVPKEEREYAQRSLRPVNKLLAMSLNMSNFIQEIQPTYLDLITVGTGAMRISPKINGQGVTFKNIPIDHIAIEEGYDSRVDRIYQQMHMTGHQAMQEYGEKMPDGEFKKAIQKDPTKEYELLSIVAPVDDFSTDSGFVHIIMPWKMSDEIIHEQKMDYNPYLIARWEKMPRTPYGRGLGHIAYADVKALNRIKELNLQGLALSVAGAWTGVDDGVFNPGTVNIRPGVVIPVLSNDQQNPALRRIDTPSDLNAGRLGIQDMRADVQRMLMADRFSPTIGTKMSATEILQRAQIIQQELGASYTMLVNELLTPLVQTLIKLIGAQQDDPSLGDLKIDGPGLDVMFMASIAQSQRLAEANNMLEYATILQQFAQVDPSVQAIMDLPSLMRSVAELMSVDAEVIRSEEETAEYNRQGMQGAAQMEMMSAGQGQPAEQAGGGPQPTGGLPQ